MAKKHCGIRIETEIKEQLDKLAIKEGRTFSNLVQKILKEYLKCKKGDLK